MVLVPIEYLYEYQIKRDKILEAGYGVSIEKEIPTADPACISFSPHDHLEDLGVCGKVTLKWIIKEYDWMCGLN